MLIRVIRGSLIPTYIMKIFFSHRSHRFTQIIFSHTNIYFLSRISRISSTLCCSEANNKICVNPYARNQFNQSNPYSKIKSVFIRVIRGSLKIFVLFVRFVRLLPVGQWVFDESRVQAKNPCLSVFIRVLTCIIHSMMIMYIIRSNLFFF